MRVLSLPCLLVLLAALPAQPAQEKPAVDYPVKKARTLHTAAEVAAARANVDRFPEAARLRDQVVQAAEKWAAWSDDRLAALVIPPCVPRAFNISFSGCPVHGREAFKTGNYSFKIDLDRPFKVVCPVGGEEYPSNDFAAYLASGMRDRSLLTGPYADDGWGWKKEGEDKKYWFVAYYTHWSYLWHVIPGTLALSRAYLLTGNPRYAHQAIILLDRIADVYPAMDHNKQSRYATEFVPSYTGKIVNLIWETGVGRDLCEAYDNVWEAIDADSQAQRFLGKSGPQIRANMERNLVREVIEGVYRGTIRGNFGMHQETLLTAAVVAQAGDESQVAEYLLGNTGQGFALEGYRYALANHFTREGISCRETAPGYCTIWADQVVDIAGLLGKLGVDLFGDGRLRQLMLARERMIMLDAFTPAIGDSGSVTSGAVRLPARLAAVGFRHYGDPAFARALQRAGGGQAIFADYDDLFHAPVALPADLPPAEPPGSDLMDSYGLALLRSGRQPWGWSLFYGPSPGHGHHDKLNIELFALGRRLLPDLGYPQFAADDPEPPGWSRNTISHNTVVVDARQQTTVRPGQVRFFAELPGTQLVEVDAPAAYQGLVTRYRRTLVSVDLPQGGYGVDIFRVRGGRQHDYSLHGPEGDFSVGGLELSPPQTEGTLAGPEVPYAFFYDDPRFAEKGERQGYHRYQGSGFSFLTNVRRGQAGGPWWAEWRLSGEPSGRLRITRLPQGLQEEIVCAGKPPYNPSNPPVLTYTLSRRQGRGPLQSTFVSLIEPYAQRRQVLSVRSLTRGEGDDPVALQVRHQEGMDLVVSTAGKPWRGREGSCTARVGLLGTDRSGNLQRAWLVAGGELARGGLALAAGPDVAGRVIAVDYAQRRVTVRLPRGREYQPAALAGCLVRFSNPRRVSGFRVAAAQRQGDHLILTLNESPAAGLVLVKALDARLRLQTAAHLPQRDVRRYDGLTLADAGGRPLFRVIGAEGDPAELQLARLAGIQATAADLGEPGRTLAYLWEVGPGDRAEIQAQVWVEAAESGWTVQANAGFALTLPSSPGIPLHLRWQPESGPALIIRGRGEGDRVRFLVPARALGSGRGQLTSRLDRDSCL